MSYKTSCFRCLEHRVSILNEYMDDQGALNIINNKLLKEELQSFIKRANSTSFIFSIKNRIGGLPRVLKVFQKRDINEIHIESLLSHRTNSQYEIYLDLEANRARIQQSMKALKRQVSCVEFDRNVRLESNNKKKNCTITNGDENIDLPPSSRFLNHDGQVVERHSKLY